MGRLAAFLFLSLTAGCVVRQPPAVEAPEYQRAPDADMSPAPDEPAPAPAPAPVVVEHDWHYDPAYDVYYSSQYGWCYWSGVEWVIAPRRPAWVVVGPRTGWVTIRAGRRPHRRWTRHHRRYHRRSAPRAHRRGRGRRGRR